MKKNLFNLLAKIKDRFLDLPLKLKIIIPLLVLAIGFGSWKLIASGKTAEVSYQTAVAKKGTLISSISGSGTITSGNYTNITTKTSGVVSRVYVTNGDVVTKGQEIAVVELDDYAKERQAEAWVDYLEAKEAYLLAVSGKSQADIDMWQAREEVLDAEEAVEDLQNGGVKSTGEEYSEGERKVIYETLEQKKAAFDLTEAKYNNSGADISNAQSKVAAALRDYQENAATIVAPSDGVITDLALAEGIIVSASSTTSSTSGATIVSAQTVGKINDTEGQLIATVDLTEVDIINVEANQKVTLTLDAYEDSSFTGKVMAVNTSGSVSSGVTSYPVTILLDPVDVDVYPNMAVSVEIITNIVTDQILVSTSAIQLMNDQNYVEVMKDGEVTSVAVEIGDSNDTQTIIISGISEGDTIVTSTITTSDDDTDSNTSSPFSTTGGGGGGGGTRALEGGASPGGF